ncbi:MAG: hypothetical protein R2880_10260 [Deinococcales bacterium]
MIEICHYILSLQGKVIGSHSLRTYSSRNIISLEAKLILQGSRKQIIQQQSRIHAPSLQSLFFQEESQDHDKRQFSVRFDKESGLVKVTKGKNDQASSPYIQPYQDPLSLLYYLRHFCHEDHLRIPMLGKDVTARFLREDNLSGALGQRLVRIYDLQPGGSYVYIDNEAPHYILRLGQRIDHQIIEANLVNISHEKLTKKTKSDFKNDKVQRFKVKDSIDTSNKDKRIRRRVVRKPASK